MCIRDRPTTVSQIVKSLILSRNDDEVINTTGYRSSDSDRSYSVVVKQVSLSYLCVHNEDNVTFKVMLKAIQGKIV